MTPRGRKYRSQSVVQHVIGFSMSYQRETLLPRGLGLEHLRELLIRLARPLLRHNASLAYGGNWRDSESNFTYELLRLINAEHEETLDEPGPNRKIGQLYNHLAWPDYLEVKPVLEAQWINCCRVVRVTQRHAGFALSEIAADDEASLQSDRGRFNAACTLSTMRRLMHEQMAIEIPGLPNEAIPAVNARIMLGGKVRGFKGLAPGIFEEALNALEANCPLYLLGGFGGATEVLTNAILSDSSQPPRELTVGWHERYTDGYAQLQRLLDQFPRPARLRTSVEVFEGLWRKLVAAQKAFEDVLRMGLSPDESRELMTTHDIPRAVHLVRTGLAKRLNLDRLPA